MPYPLSRREHFFVQLKHNHPNIYAVYLMVSIVSVWSGSWYIADTWASGQSLLAAATAVAPAVAARHLLLLLLGLTMLYVDDRSLEELILMKASPLKPSSKNPRGLGRLFIYLKRHHPNLVAIYTCIGIILTWCGTWGLIGDIPVHPFGRSLLTVSLGFLMLYIDDFKLTEL